MFSYFILLFSHKTSFLLCIFAFILSHSCFFYCFLLHRLLAFASRVCFCFDCFLFGVLKGKFFEDLQANLYIAERRNIFFLYIWIFFSLFHKLLLTLNVLENEFVGLRVHILTLLGNKKFAGLREVGFGWSF